MQTTDTKVMEAKSPSRGRGAVAIVVLAVMAVGAGGLYLFKNQTPAQQAAVGGSIAPSKELRAPVDGQWNVVVVSPMGDQKSLLTLTSNGETLTGTTVGASETSELKEGEIKGNQLSWKTDITKPIALRVETVVLVDGDRLEGTAKAGMFGSFKLTGTRVRSAD